MAVRPIDAGILQDNLTDIYGDGNRLVYLKDVLGLIDEQPTLPLYDIDGVAARYPAHCADTTDGIDNLKFEKVTRRPPEGEA